MRIYRDCEHVGAPVFRQSCPSWVFIRGDGTFVTALNMIVQYADTIPLADNDPLPFGAQRPFRVDVGYYSATVNLPFAADGYYFVYQLVHTTLLSQWHIE